MSANYLSERRALSRLKRGARKELIAVTGSTLHLVCWFVIGRVVHFNFLLTNSMSPNAIIDIIQSIAVIDSKILDQSAFQAK
jgi:hypothetical protein